MTKKRTPADAFFNQKTTNTTGVLDDQRTLLINTGEPSRDYRGGDFLNALNYLACWFENKTELSSDHIADLMQTYATEMKN